MDSWSGECPLSFNEVDALDADSLKKYCPTHHAVITGGVEVVKNASHSFLVSLQGDLELINDALLTRIYALKQELQKLCVWQQQQLPSSSSPVSLSTPTSGTNSKKRKADSSDGSVVKRVKSDNGSSKNRKKKSTTAATVSGDDDSSDVSGLLELLPEGSSLLNVAGAGACASGNKAKQYLSPQHLYWESLEKYFAPFTIEELDSVLNSIMNTKASSPDLYVIPPLGEHYTDKWAAEDLVEERQRGAVGNGYNGSSNSNTRPLEVSSTSLATTSATNRSRPPGVADGGDGISFTGDSVCGAVTKRIMSALITENIMPLPSVTNSYRGSEGGKLDNSGRNGTTNIKKDKANLMALEWRIRHQLRDAGVLSDDDVDEGNSDMDDVCEALRTAQMHLRAQVNRNRDLERQLREAAIRSHSSTIAANRLHKANVAVEALFRAWLRSSSNKPLMPGTRFGDACKQAIDERDLAVAEFKKTEHK